MVTEHWQVGSLLEFSFAAMCRTLRWNSHFKSFGLLMAASSFPSSLFFGRAHCYSAVGFDPYA